jgi:hypothetical protein
MCRANSNGGVLPRMIIGPNGAQTVAPISSSSEPSSPYRGNDACHLLQERDEVWALYSNAVRDLGWMDFHMNAMQNALTILENRANTVQTRLAKDEARITGEISSR